MYVNDVCLVRDVSVKVHVRGWRLPFEVGFRAEHPEN